MDDSWPFPCNKERRMLDRIKLAVRMEAANRRSAIPVKCRGGNGMGWGWVVGVGHHEQSHNWETVLTVNQQPNNMISVAYANITVHYSLKTGRENRKLSYFSLSLFFVFYFFTLNVYFMKALGVVHFKGNWTNKKKTLSTLPSSCLSEYRALPPPLIPTVISNGQSS